MTRSPSSPNARHAASKAALMFTAGPAAIESWGHAAGEQVYHSSLDPDEYKALFAENGFEMIVFVPEDPECNGHSIWMARFES